MKCFLAVLLVLLETGMAHGQTKPDNGVWWANCSSELKLGFVSGYVHAMVKEQDFRSFQCIADKGKQPSHDVFTECLQSPEVARYDFTGIRMGQFAEGVDTFYKDPHNKNLEIDFALKYVRDKLKGKSSEELEQELKTFRDIPAQSPRGK